MPGPLPYASGPSYRGQRQSRRHQAEKGEEEARIGHGGGQGKDHAEMAERQEPEDAMMKVQAVTVRGSYFARA